MSILSDMFNKNLGGGNWQKRFGIEGDILSSKTYHDAWGGGEWMNRFGLKGGPKGLGDSGDWLTKTSKWYNQLGGREFDEAWGGGAWLTDRMGIDPQEQLDTASEIVASNTGVGPETIPNTQEDAEKLAKGFDLGAEQEERDRLARMRRMLAGRYGRAETNLTGGTGFGSGSQRTLGGYS